ncbi:MAG: GGDEF domain-containing protein [Devosia sp.]
MLPAKTLIALQSWSSVGRWTLLGTLLCIVISVVFNALVFGDLGGPALRRSLLSATVLPAILGLPLFLFAGMRVRSLALSNMRLGLLARTDSLTACLNRGAFTARVGILLGQRQPHTTGAFLMIDADNFKDINDLFGHVNGDEALAIIARSIQAVLRTGDLLGRMGGEEFAVYLPDLDHRQTAAISERIRRSVYLANFAPEGCRHTLSVSIGGAVFEGQAGFAELFRIADERLYDAKKSGRNRAAVVNVADLATASLQRTA